MLRYIKKYPVSLLVILTVTYLSFFHVPSTRFDGVSGIDKLVHICMYMGMSGMLWLEFLRAHRRDVVPVWHAWIGATLCPIVFSGMVELLQACTPHRSGDWMDFVANCTGVLLATVVGRLAFGRFGRRRQAD